MSTRLEVPTSARAVDIYVDRSMILELDTTPGKLNVDNIARCFSSWVALLADSPLAATEGRKPRRVFKAFRRDLVKGPLVDIILQYASLGHQLTLSVSGTPSDPKVAWVDGFERTPVFREWLMFYREKDPNVLRYLYSFCLFAKKLDYTDDALHATALRAWKRIEERLSSLSLNSDLIAGMALVTKELTRGFDINPFWPKHGPGAVAERGVRGVRAKCDNIRFDPRIDELFYSGPRAIMGLLQGRGRPYFQLIPNEWCWSNASSLIAEAVAAYMDVSKDMTKSRSICMEPVTYMYHQQGVLKSLLRCMRATRARRFINIQDQSRNARLARYGSVTGRIDTIDLSSASDSVHWRLVEGIFPEDVREYLFATRTQKVRLPDGEIVTVNKFAPMGSALCFPVQCLVFTTVVIYAAMLKASYQAAGDIMDIRSPMFEDMGATIDLLFRKDEGSRIRYRRDDEASLYTVRGFYEPAAIYGDDICVDSELTPIVTHLLQTLGFEVNMSKSFTGQSAFRESCGGFYCWGHDVTPLRFQIVRSTEQLSSNTVASYIPMINRCGDYGYMTLRRVLLHDLLHTAWEGIGLKAKQPVLFTSDKTLSGSAIIVENPCNDHIKRRWGNYHRYECRHAVIVPLETEDDIVERRLSEYKTKRFLADGLDYSIESYLYLRWWATKPEGSASDDASLDEMKQDGISSPFWSSSDQGSSASRFYSSGTRIDWRWTPVD